MNDQIKLAEAMNLLPKAFADNGEGWDSYRRSITEYDGEVRRILLGLIPDPFTDANDDYAVLEWMRENRDRGFGEHWELTTRSRWAYKIGDYARAALKVIDND